MTYFQIDKLNFLSLKVDNLLYLLVNVRDEFQKGKTVCLLIVYNILAVSYIMINRIINKTNFTLFSII